MTVIKFHPGDKIRIYCCDFDVVDCDYEVRNYNYEERDEWEFTREDYVSKMFLTECDALQYAFNYSTRIYFDNQDFIFDIMLISHDMEVRVFENIVISESDITIECKDLIFEHLIYQDPKGDASQRKLLSRKIIRRPNYLHSQDGILCPDCKGVKK